MDDVQKSGLLHLLLVMLSVIAFYAFSSVASANPVSITDQMHYLAERSSKVEISADMKQRIDTLAQTINNPEWQQRQESMKSRIRASLGMEEEAEDSDDRLPTQDRPVLFVSSSIPMSTLRAYAKDLAKTGGVMVLRGGIEGLRKITPTLRFTAEILKKDPLCEGARCPMLTTPVLIDPVLFKRYQIKAVPALAFQRNMDINSYCERPESLEYVDPDHIVYGDSALSGMLQELFRMTKDQRIKPFLKVLHI